MNNFNPCQACSLDTNRTTSKTTIQTNFILETVKNIDKMQKEIAKETGCTGCNDLLVSTATLFNTKPVIFRFANGETFNAVVGVGGDTTSLFRIQDVKGTVVVLRLLTYDETTLNPISIGNDITLSFKGRDLSEYIDVTDNIEIECKKNSNSFLN